MSGEQYVIWSLQHGRWWAANSCGYVEKLRDAGVYEEAEAFKIVAHANIRTFNEAAIPVRVLGAAWPRTPDVQTECWSCPKFWLDLYAAARKVLAGTRSHFLAHERLAPDEYEVLYLTAEAARPFVEAHYANQDHALSPELEDARHPILPTETLTYRCERCGRVFHAGEPMCSSTRCLQTPDVDHDGSER